jgi:hypothetical protein
LRSYAAPSQFPDLADRIVLRAASTSGKRISRRPDERYQRLLPTFLWPRFPDRTKRSRYAGKTRARPALSAVELCR